MTEAPELFHGIYDCVIAGGGPAGLTAGIFLGRFRRKVVIVDNGRPRNEASRGIHGFLGWSSIPPGELLRKGREQAIESGAVVLDGEVTRVHSEGDVFIVRVGSNELRARRLMLAYGVRDVLPDIEGFDESYGRGVYHCPDCDGFEVRDRKVGVLGSGAGAIHVALRLRLWTDDLTILTNGKVLEASEELVSKLEASEIRRVDERVIRIDEGPEDFIEGVVLENGHVLDLDALFFSLGRNRSSDLAEQLGCRISEESADIVVGDRGETSIEGVWAAGDLTPGSKLAISAAANGAVAAIAINESLTAPGDSL